MTLFPKRTRTQAGVSWIKDSLAITAKILATRIGIQYFLDRGYDRLEIGSNWDRICPGSGFMGRDHFRKMQDKVCVMLPGFREYFEEKSSHTEGLGYALTHRARHSIAKDELARFRTAPWCPFYKMVRDALDTNTPITPAMRYAAHETIVYQQVTGHPGVYINQSCETPEWFYLGESVDVARRNAGHRNSNLFLTRVYVTGDKPTAVALQNQLFQKLEETDLIVQRRYPDQKPGSQGAMKLDKGINPVDLLDGIVKQHYREFCRATLGWL